MFKLMEQFVEDFVELRKRLIISVSCFFVLFIVSFGFAGVVIRILLNNGPVSKMFVSSFAPWDVIQVYLKCAFFLASGLSLPVLMFQIWLYIRPALTKSERKIVLMYIPCAVILLGIGIGFSYCIAFKLAFLFTTEVARQLQIQTVYGVAEYFSFLLSIVVPVSFLFEMPIVGMFLTRIGVISPEGMIQFRKVAYMILLVVATAITPPDFISDIILIMPLLGLYECSIAISKVTYKKMQRCKGV